MSSKSNEQFQLIHLDESDNQTSLGRALKKRLSTWTWGQTREAILKRRVQVNGNLCLDEARKVTAKDVIKLWNQSLPKPVQPSNIRIAHADDFLVVVEKPAGITSTRHFEERLLAVKRRQLQPTLEELLPEALMQYFQSKSARSDKEFVPRSGKSLNARDAERARQNRLKRFAVVAVHRLDRDTSGLMLFARTPGVAQSLGKAFRKHQVTRRYHAVVHGHPEAQTFDSVLVRDRGDGRRGSMPEGRTEDRTAQRAITHVRPVERIGPYSLIECELETGRTHQIRIHLAEAGHMLCGEPIYNRSLNGISTADDSGAPRQALHSATLAFKHPLSNDSLEFRMPWPADLHKWLRELKKKHAIG